jgi:hypothetical protein
MALLLVDGEAAGGQARVAGILRLELPGFQPRFASLGSLGARRSKAGADARGLDGNDVERQAAQPVAGEFHRNAGMGLSIKVSTHLRSRARAAVLRNSAEVAEGR